MHTEIKVIQDSNKYCRISSMISILNSFGKCAVQMSSNLLCSHYKILTNVSFYILYIDIIGCVMRTNETTLLYVHIYGILHLI